MSLRVLFVITCLETGGAERQLAQLVASLRERGVETGVVSLIGPGAITGDIAALGIPVWHLGVANPLSVVRGLVRLISITQCFRPDVIQGWMYHANLAAFLSARLMSGRSPLVFWGIRQSLYELKKENMLTRLIILLGAKLSSKVNGIVYNATISRKQHEAIGFRANSGCVIFNGFDTKVWHPDDLARRDIRGALGIRQDTPLIGMIARFHPVKGHKVFLEAAVKIASLRSEVEFVLAGPGVDKDNPLFAAYLSQEPLIGRLHLLGLRQDIPKLMAALDIATSASWAEGFSNSIAEALLCGVPVVATDVGESRAIVGDSGMVVPPGDAQALSNAWSELLDMSSEMRRLSGMKGRERLLKAYAMESVADQYLRLYRNETYRALR